MDTYADLPIMLWGDKFQMHFSIKSSCKTTLNSSIFARTKLSLPMRTQAVHIQRSQEHTVNKADFHKSSLQRVAPITTPKNLLHNLCFALRVLKSSLIPFHSHRQLILFKLLWPDLVIAVNHEDNRIGILLAAESSRASSTKMT